MTRNNNQSPNEADGLTLLVHAARKGSGVVLSMKLDETSNIPGGSDDGWDESQSYPGGVKIDVTNRTDYLEQPIV